jgi:hypothetical protein
MRLDVLALTQTPGLLMVALMWIAVHGALLCWVAYLTRAPFFFVAVGCPCRNCRLVQRAPSRQLFALDLACCAVAPATALLEP